MSDQPAHLLVVDDEEFNRDLLKRRLERQGFRVDAVASGKAGLAALGAEPYDLVLLDIQMPGMSGLEVLDAIRLRHPSGELPVIMTTALADAETTVAALDRGANDYLTKPIDMAIALARVRSHLRNRKRRPAALNDWDSAETASSDGAFADRWPADASALPAEPSDLIGRDLGGKYRVERLIGRGGFAAVYQATHLGLQTQMAVKVLLVSRRPGPAHLERFRREAISACRIRHPNAVQVFDIDVTSGGLPFLVMELLEGRSLDAELAAASLPARRAGEILIPVCDVLIEAHGAGIIHRDLKPANVFLHHDRQGESVKVVDFGLAKMVAEASEFGEQQVSYEGQILGTPAYMPPERFRGQPYDGRSDTYSLGVMLYRMLGGVLPFHGTSDLMQLAMRHMMEAPAPLGRLRPDLAEPIPDLVLGALAKSPADRPPLRDLAREFARAVGLNIDPAVYRNLA